MKSHSRTWPGTMSGLMLVGLLSTASIVFGAPPQSDTRARGEENSNTRAGSWEQRRREKLRHIEPPRVGKLEKVFQELENRTLTGLLRYRDFYFSFGNLSTGSGFAPGVRYWNPNLGGTTLDLQASSAFSTRGYQLFNLQFGRSSGDVSDLFVRPNASTGFARFSESERERGLFLYGDFRYRRFPQEDFFGLGPDTSKTDRTDYLLEDATYSGVLGYQFNRHVSAATRAGFIQTNIGHGTDRRFFNTETVFTDLAAPGLNRQPDFIFMKSALLLDYRDKPGNPHRGGMAGLTLSRFDDRGGNRFEFTRFAFDARGYLPLGSDHRVLAARLLTSTDHTEGPSRVPFYMEETLGGSDTLRGFREFRFRDKNLLYLSGEYRWEAAAAVELALFYDTGKVFRRSGFNFERLRKSYGTGIRFKTRDSVIVRFDVARSGEGTRLFLKFGPSF